MKLRPCYPFTKNMWGSWTFELYMPEKQSTHSRQDKTSSKNRIDQYFAGPADSHTLSLQHIPHNRIKIRKRITHSFVSILYPNKQGTAPIIRPTYLRAPLLDPPSVEPDIRGPSSREDMASATLICASLRACERCVASSSIQADVRCVWARPGHERGSSPSFSRCRCWYVLVTDSAFTTVSCHLP